MSGGGRGVQGLGDILERVSSIGYHGLVSTDIDAMCASAQDVISDRISLPSSAWITDPRSILKGSRLQEFIDLQLPFTIE